MSLTAPPDPRHATAGPPRLRWVLVLTASAFFMTALDALVVANALPQIEASLHMGFAGLQWTVNAYNIALAAGIICGAALGDRFGRRRMFVVGLLVFTAASAGCALAPSAALLIGARTVQGLGGAMVIPISLTILTEAFPVERRAAVIGAYGGLAGIAVALGPILGGLISEGIDWHWIFWVNVPIGLTAALLSARLLPETFGASGRIDVPGVALVTAGVVGVVWALVRADASGWDSPEILAMLVLGIVALAAFVLWERWAREPMMPLRLLGVRSFAAGNAAAFMSWAAINVAAFLATQYFQFALGYSPVETGIRLLPFFATPLVVAPIAGAVSQRVGLRPVIVLGLALLAAGIAWVALEASTRPSYPAIVIGLAVAGVGISMSLPTVPTAVLDAVSPEEMGTASGVNNMLQRFGGVFGIAVGTAVFGARGGLGTPASFTDGFRPALGVAAALAVCGALAALALPGRARAEAPAGILVGEPR